MKESFKISKYVSIWYIDEDGTKREPLMDEAQIGQKIYTGKNLIARTVEPDPKKVDLGVVEEGRNYIKGSSVDIKTDKGWLHVEYNNDLTWLLSDGIEFPDSI